MNWKELNKLLSNLKGLRHGAVSKQVVKVLDSEGNQGESGLSFEVYKLANIKDENGDDIYIKLRIETDSYGDNEFVAGLEFVKPIIKTVTDFEAIK